MKDLTLLFCWGYLLIAVAGLIPFFWYWLRPKGTYFPKNPIDEIAGLSDEGRKRLNQHFDREKITWDYTRNRIDRYQLLQTYISIVSVIAPILLTVLAANGTKIRRFGMFFAPEGLV
jgi:hypothetical protein